MEPSRSSSRFRENVKTKFKNTSNTPLTVDDDDDFVSPAPGINIPGNKQGVLDAGQKPKFTKSTASRMQQDCSKGKAVGGQKEVTKILGPIQDDKGLEKRVNTKKTVTETSGERKGKMKVVDKSNTKNRKDAEKKRNPPVKKRKLGGNEGTNKLTYVYSVKVPVNNLKKGRPFIKYGRSIHLDDIQKEEIKQNKLGMGEIEKRCSENFDTSNDDTDLQEIQNMFGNVEAYCAVIELGYNKIVSEKLNLEKALSDGLEKYPESGVLKEWLHKKNMLFKEEDEIVDEDLHENEEDEDDVEKSDDRDEGQKEKQIESHKSEHVVGVGMESNLNLNVINTDGSRVGEYQAKEDMADRRVYDTPKSFAQIESEDISATQFFEDPAVLEQVIDVLDKSSEKYYKDKVSESAKVEGHVENERIIENVTSRVLDKGKNILTELDHAAGVGEDGNAYLMDENELEINRRRLFVDQMLLYIGNFEINPKFRDVGLVFFPIVARDNYYLLCFDLRRPFYYIIDHLKRNGNQQSSYGRVPQIVKDKVMLESEAYDNLDLWEKTIKLDEYAKSKKKKKQMKKA
ncbi:hypothetical protein L1887_39389 [Cichorium endivia]|nr:hypothetical protein L1887_39389 [Cichorium endivia]